MWWRNFYLHSRAYKCKCRCQSMFDEHHYSLFWIEPFLATRCSIHEKDLLVSVCGLWWRMKMWGRSMSYKYEECMYEVRHVQCVKNEKVHWHFCTADEARAFWNVDNSSTKLNKAQLNKAAQQSAQQCAQQSAQQSSLTKRSTNHLNKAQLFETTFNIELAKNTRYVYCYFWKWASCST